MIDYNSAPWLSSYGDRMFNLEYPKGSISDKVLETADEVPSNVALSYMGVKTTFRA